MGLDMYLYAGSPDKINKDECFFDTSPLGDELAYWRKAYTIDRWFDKHCKCIEEKCIYEVTRDNLKDLIRICMEVLLLEDPEYAYKHLPYKEEYKETDYDWIYFDNLRETIDKLMEVLSRNPSKIFTYIASW